MNCPTCANVKLVISERASIEIDYCPECRGVWLDRGELDKILERSREGMGSEQPAPMAPSSQSQRPQYPQQPQYSDNRYYKRKKSFLEELFD